MAQSVTAAAHDVHEHHELGFVRTYIFSTDHKMIARQFLFLGLFMLLIGGALAMLIRWQLGFPETAVPAVGGWLFPETEGIIAPEVYNMLFTMHATIMIFFVVMPVMVGCFGNFLIPLMLGARDMAFPKLNMLSFWTGAVSGVIMLAGFFVPGGHAAAGWTAYAPLSSTPAVLGRRLGTEPLADQSVHPGRVVHDGLDQLHHDRGQHAGARDDALPDAPRDLVLVHHGDPAPARPAGADVGGGDAPLRPHDRDPLVRPGGGRRAAALAAPLLVLRAPGGLHPGASRDGGRPPTSCPPSRGSRSSGTGRWPTR